jgi:hypothetical protein
MNFFQELKEARMFGNVETLQGQTSSSLADMAYTMMLMLELQRKDMDSNWAKKYAESTIKYNDFSDMRLGGTDLHNLLSVLNHIEDYVDEVRINSKVSVPVLTLKRYFKDIRDGRNEPRLDRELFQRLEFELSIHDSQLKNLRRAILAYDSLEKSEIDMLYQNVRKLLNKHAYRSDIAVKFNSK